MRTSIKTAYITNNCSIGDFYGKKLFKKLKYPAVTKLTELQP